MKKFLLSIFALMLAVFSVQAEEKNGTITFKTSGSDSSNAATTSNFVTDQVTSDGGFTLSCTATNNCYTGKSGLKMSSSSKNGSFTLNLGGTYNVKTITVSAVKYGSDAGKVATAQSLSSSDATDYTFAVNSEIDQIKVDMTKRGYIASITIVYEVAGEGGGETPEPPTAPTLTPSCSFDDAMTVEITNIADGATAYYSLNNDIDWTGGTSVTISETTTVYAKVVKDELSSDVVFATYTKNEPLPDGWIDDVLDHNWAGITGTNYSGWSGKKATSLAVYAGNSAGDKSSIQLRSNNSNSGIVTTQSGGKAKKVVVVWNSNTADGRTLNIYGKNSAYTAATDLYNNSNQGTLLGTIVKGTSTKLEITGDYEFIGLRSNSGAMYLTSVSITWDASTGVTVVPDAPTLPASTNFENEFEVTITAEDGAAIYYTTDGTEPTTASTVYSAPFTISETTTVKAIAVKDDVVSIVAEATYTKVKLIDLSNCTVAEAIEAYKNGQTGIATITAYIVGAANGGLSKAEFTSETTVETNILIADNADETDVENCMPIKLASGTVIREALNLGANKNVYKKKVTIECELGAYFSVAGTQNVKTAGLYWNVTDAGYATLYLGYKAVIPSTVNAYIVEGTNSTHAIMKEVEGIVDANTGLILEGEGEHLFNITSKATTADVEGNLLKGTVVDENIAEAAYVLGIVEGEVGLYLAEMAGGVWLNNANKAYLPIASGAAMSASLRFDFGGTTGVEKVEIRNEKEEIYDLTGRRVNEITKAGVYIIGGHKVLVK